MYISQDPIGLEGGDKFYSYVHDPNGWIDPLGLTQKSYNQKNKKKNDAKKDRSPHPIGRRIYFPSKKKAKEAAKQAGKGKEPILHTDGHGPHYHPGDGKGKPLNHDHYYFPKGKL